MDKLKMFYSGGDFGSKEVAWADFERRWAEHNPEVARELKLEALKDQYEGAHYRDGRWYLCTEVNDYRNADPTPSRGGADNVIGNCPQCGRGGLMRRANWPASSICIHITAKEDGKEVVIFAHPIMPQRDRIIDASSI
jgi:hypothetical protein